MFMKKLTILSVAFLLSFSLISYAAEAPGDGPPGTPPPTSGEAPGDGWAPLTRWVVHPVTGFIIELELIEELPTKAFYQERVKSQPPIKGACEVEPGICILNR